MPLPSPTPPTAAQIETLVDITQLSTEAVTAMLGAYDQDISNAKWALTLLDLAEWPDIKAEAGDVKRVGSIEFFEGASGKYALSFINRIRTRYGQTTLATTNGSSAFLYVPSGAAVTITNDY